jgi:hypothetical protein
MSRNVGGEVSDSDLSDEPTTQFKGSRKMIKRTPGRGGGGGVSPWPHVVPAHQVNTNAFTDKLRIRKSNDKAQHSANNDPRGLLVSSLTIG